MCLIVVSHIPLIKQGHVNQFEFPVSGSSQQQKKPPGNTLPGKYRICRRAESGISFHEYASKVKRTANTMTPSDVQHWKSKIPMIYINIESKKERNEHMKKTFSNLFGTIIRSEGVLRDNEEVKNLLTVMKDVDPNILAVTLSHLNAIKLAKKTITELNNPLIQHAVIMEDDADIILMPFWQRSLDEIVKTFPSGWEVVQLSLTKVALDYSPEYNIFRYPRGNSLPILANRPEWGAVAYIISNDGMDKIINTNFIKLYEECNPLTADDCLLSFTPFRFGHKSQGFAYNNQYAMHPPMFTIYTDAAPSHRKGQEETNHKYIALSARCGSLYENLLYFNKNGSIYGKNLCKYF